MLRIEETAGPAGPADESAVRRKYAALTRSFIRAGLTLTAMESCTGGQIASLVTDTEGSSAVLAGALVTYSNAAKISELDVSPETLEKYGAISAQTAEEMVRGLSLYSGASVCVSVTGNAGPDADEGKPVGQFFVGIMYDGKVTVREFMARRKTRDDVRSLACTEMTKMVYNILRSID